MKLHLENVRSFAGEHAIELTPLTLLVGENSTGKTTFMSMLAAALRGEILKTSPDFNTTPFDLGSFDTIATFRGGKAGRSNSFSVGISRESRRSQSDVEFRSSFDSDNGQCRLKLFKAKSPRGDIKVDLSGGRFDVVINVENIRSKEIVQLKTSAKFDSSDELLSSSVLSYVLSNSLDFLRSSRSDPDPNMFKGKDRNDLFALQQSVVRLIRELEQVGGPVLAMSPVRSKPARTYDEIRDDFRPGGDHIPMVLARIFQEKKESEVLNYVKQFGESSGLLKDIHVRRLGRHTTDPFQLLVKGLRGPAANISDVGYGVSQALPVLVESILMPEGDTLLIQQPEVHLHPKAQASLGSFFANQTGSLGKRFVIETHSDYLLDRVRREVAVGNISAKSVKFLFFDKPKLDTVVHDLSLDSLGNIENAPAAYRMFFLEEELDLMNRGVE